MSGESFIARLSLPPDALSPNRVSSQHWRYRQKATKAYRKACWAAIRAARPAYWTAKAVSVAMDYYCCRESRGYKPRDAQNALSAIKAAVDGMVDAGVVPSDAKKFVEWWGLRLHSTRHDLKMALSAHEVTLDGCVVLTITAL